MSRQSRKSGWTMIEVLIAAVLGSLLFGTILGVMVQMRLEEEVGSRRLDALESAQSFLEQLTDDIQHLTAAAAFRVTTEADGGTAIALERWSDDPDVAPGTRVNVRWVVSPAPGGEPLEESRVQRTVDSGGADPRVATYVAGILREARLERRATETAAAAGTTPRLQRVWLEVQAVIESPAVDGRRTRLPLHVQIVPREANRALRAHWIGAAS